MHTSIKWCGSTSATRFSPNAARSDLTWLYYARNGWIRGGDRNAPTRIHTSHNSNHRMLFRGWSVRIFPLFSLHFCVSVCVSAQMHERTAHKHKHTRTQAAPIFVLFWFFNLLSSFLLSTRLHVHLPVRLSWICCVLSIIYYITYMQPRLSFVLISVFFLLFSSIARQRCSYAGFTSYLVKPVSREKLVHELLSQLSGST